MNIFVVTSEVQESQIHKISVDNGKYLRPTKITGTMKERGDVVFSNILHERPNKVIVEEIGFGKGVLDSLISAMNYHGFSLEKDGTVKYL